MSSKEAHAVGEDLRVEEDRLVPLQREALQIASPWASPVYLFEEVTSTNDLALDLGEKGAEEGTLIFAETQTAGRGRFHRPWSSPPGKGLWFSLLLRPVIHQAVIPALSQFAAVALCDALERVLKTAELHIKEPNDVFLRKRKVAGILVETRPGTSSFAVVGIGLNVHQRTEDFPPELREGATSLALFSDCIVDRQALAAILLEALGRRHQQFLSDETAPILEAAWRSRLPGSGGH